MTAISSRSMVATFLFAATTCCAEPAATHADGEEDKPKVFTGCIGQTLEDCVDSVKRYVPDVADGDVQAPDFTPDIQGKVPTTAQADFGTSVAGDARAGRQVGYRFIPTFGAKRRITSMIVAIRGVQEGYPRTEAEYETMGIYEALAGVSRGGCPKSVEAFYKAFDSNTREKLSFREVKPSKYSKFHWYEGEAGPFPACGLSVKYTIKGVQGAKQENPANVGFFTHTVVLEVR